MRLTVDLVSFLSFARIDPVRLCPWSLPARAFRSVDFPLPDGPRTARISPGRAMPVTPFKMVFSSIVTVDDRFDDLDPQSKRFRFPPSLVSTFTL